MKLLVRLFIRLRAWWTRPQQQALPFWCELHGVKCEYIHDETCGFYGRCRVCGEVYEPGCDR